MAYHETTRHLVIVAFTSTPSGILSTAILVHLLLLGQDIEFRSGATEPAQIDQHKLRSLLVELAMPIYLHVSTQQSDRQAKANKSARTLV